MRITQIFVRIAQIGRDLRSQYVLSYYPANERRDGTFRRVNVLVRERNGRKFVNVGKQTGTHDGSR